MRRPISFAGRLVGACVVVACSGKPFESGNAKRSPSVEHHDGAVVPDAGGTDGEGGARPDGSVGASGGGASGGRVGSGAGGRGAGGRDVAGTTGAGGRPASGGGGTPSSGGGSGGTLTASGGAANGGAQSMDASTGGGPTNGCDVASDCPEPGTVCQKAACLGHQCGFVADPSATPPGNKPGDCRAVVCSQNGTETVLIDPNDKDDGNECTADSCQGSVASHVAQVGSGCRGLKYCDANAACVDCIDDSQCTPSGTGECGKAKCVQGTCRIPASGTLCNNGQDQCDGAGNCLDCVDSGGCGACCFCLTNFCVQG